MPSERLHIYSSSGDRETSSKTEDILFLDEELSKVDRSEYKDLWGSLTRFGNSRGEDQPVLQAIWPHVVLPGRDRKGSLLTGIILLDRISSVVNENQYKTIVVHGIDDFHRKILLDVSSMTGVEIIKCQENNKSDSPPLLTLNLLLFFFDQIISIVFNFAFSNNSDAEIVVFSFPGRYDSIKPVIEKFRKSPRILVSPLTLSWFLNQSNRFNGIESRPINTYSSPRVMLDQIKTLKSLHSQLSTGELHFEGEFQSFLRDERTLDASNTVHHASSIAIRQHIRQILTYPLQQRAVAVENPESVVVGGMSPRDRFALLAGEQQGCELYYVPHSILSGYEVMPAPRSTTYFVEGEYAVEFLRRSPLYPIVPDIVASGRPYLQKLSQTPKRGEDESSAFVITIATQPYNSEIRKEYVRTVLDAVQHIPFDHEIILKIHPSEDEAFYTEILNDRSSIELQTEAIQPVIDRSDLLITINSNVGMEAMIRGTACVSFNKWEPLTPMSPYIEEGPIPALTNETELIEYFTAFDTETQQRLLETQSGFVETKLELDQCASRIAKRIE